MLINAFFISQLSIGDNVCFKIKPEKNYYVFYITFRFNRVFKTIEI